MKTGCITWFCARVCVCECVVYQRQRIAGKKCRGALICGYVPLLAEVYVLLTALLLLAVLLVLHLLSSHLTYSSIIGAHVCVCTVRALLTARAGATEPVERLAFQSIDGSSSERGQFTSGVASVTYFSCRLQSLVRISWVLSRLLFQFFLLASFWCHPVSPVFVLIQMYIMDAVSCDNNNTCGL